ERDRDVLEQAQQNCLYGGGDAEHREQQHQEQAVSDSFHINKLFWNSDSLLPDFRQYTLLSADGPESLGIFPGFSGWRLQKDGLQLSVAWLLCH
ncbi:MAG: hypothetical protein KAJ73_09940, partial [Zetaproteobacteria bacterium]|nr:hypothetical protein [Zetaproteobacteria bacterium]